MKPELELGSQIRYFRERAGLSKSETARLLGVTPANITNWENDEYSPSILNLTALAQVLGCEASELLSVYNLACEDKLYDEEHMERKLKEWTADMEHAGKALNFAKQMHAGDYRKGPGNVPYVYHPYNMACQAFALGIADDVLISSVLLHDVVEDCGISVVDLNEDRGGSPEIRDVIRLVTKPKYGFNPDVYFEEIKKNRYACMVKLLDRCNNLSTMSLAFSREKMAEYVNETEEYIVPLLNITKYIPEWYNATYLLNYQMRSLLTTYKKLI